MDVAFVIRQRLADLGCEQRDLARAAEVTESYISQLLTRKKAPPAPHRTDMYDKIETFLQLPRGSWPGWRTSSARKNCRENWGSCPRPVSRYARLDSPQMPPDKAPYLRAIFEAAPANSNASLPAVDGQEHRQKIGHETRPVSWRDLG